MAPFKLKRLVRIVRLLATAALLSLQIACSDRPEETARLVRTVSLGKPPIAVAWRPDGKQFAAVGFGNLGVWDVSTGKQLATPSMWAIESSIAYSPDGLSLVLHKAVEGRQGTSALVWLDAQSQQALGEYFDEHPRNVNAMAFSADGRFLAVGSGKRTSYEVTILDATERKPVATLVPAVQEGYGGEPINRIVFSPDGSMVIAGGLSGALNVWSTKNWKLIRSFKAHKGYVTSMAMSLNGKWLATGSNSWGGIAEKYDPKTRIRTETKYDDPIKIWDTTTWEQVKAMPIRDKATSSLAFLPSGKHLISANADRILFWDVQAEKQVGVIRGDFTGGGALNFALTRDGEYLVVGGMGSLDVKVWKIVAQLKD